MNILHRRSLALAVAAGAAACGSSPSASVLATPPANQDERMAWWRDARFGMFLHWGLYALPAGVAGTRSDHGEWIRDTARIPVDTYEQLQAQWNPTAFDAEAWARMAADAGMKYVVITSKHHDGFCLFDSGETTWDVGSTRHGRDILRELSDACGRHGIRFCTYHSIMDWHHPDYLPRRPWEAATRSAEGADFERFERYLHAQVTEIVERYRPAVMWFDGEWEATWNHQRGVRLFELCRRLAPSMIVNNRVDVHRGGMAGFSADSEAVGDFHTPEQEIPPTGLPGVDWESCMTMNSHWGWNAADTKWKSTTELLRNLIDIASKGGNYLLNIGPRADGTFPPAAVQRLGEIGAWMRANGQAIHGTTASVFDALPFGRCTVRAAATTSTLYLHVFERPKDGRLGLPGLANKVVRAFLLQAPTDNLTIAVLPDGGQVAVMLPAAGLDAIATVVAVEIAGTPIVYRAPTIVAEASEFVRGVDVTLTAPEGLRVHYTLDGSTPTSAGAMATATVRVTASCVLRAAAFHRDRCVSEVIAREFTKVEPLPPVEPVAPHQGLRCEQFAVDWQRIPDVRGGAAAITSIATKIGFDRSPGENVALRFTGFLDVPHDDLYRFALSSDDGSKLWIGGRLVVDNDGLHGTVEKQGAIALGTGLHAIEVVWFNRSGGAELGVRWATPGQPFAAIAPAALRH